MSSIRAGSSRRFDWVMAALMVTLCAGVTLDNWGHFHGRGDESFFTPWHAILYGAMTSYGIILVLLAVANKSRGCTWRAALPPGYTLSLLGVGTFILAGLADLGWHSVFGVESDTTAYMSPTHLLLLGSGVLAGTAPSSSPSRRRTRSARYLLQSTPHLSKRSVSLALLFKHW